MTAPQAQEGVTRVAIWETVVCGIPGYHAQCMECGWRCHRQVHEREATAVRHAKAHRCGDGADEADEAGE